MPTRIFIERPTLVTTLLAFILVLGAVAMLQIGVQQIPNVSIPTVVIILSYPGASPTEMESTVVKPIEETLAGAPDLTNINSTIEEGAATVSAQFTLTSELTGDEVAVQQAVQAAEPELPANMTAPILHTYDPSEATVVTLAVSAPRMPAGEFSQLVTSSIEPTLEQSPGVGNVSESGEVTPAVEVTVDPDKLSALGATLNQVLSAISVNNVLAPGGIVYSPGRETTVNVRGDITGAASVAALLVPTSSGSTNVASSEGTNPWSTSPAIVHVGDIATVTDAYEPQQSYAFTHGQPVVLLQVQKAANASDVATVNGVVRLLPRLQQLYHGVNFTVINDQATYTEQQITGVMHTLLEGVVLVALVMILFLRSWRSAVVVMISMPASLLVTVGVMALTGFTIDTFSLMAMTLVIGILVDDSIVVLENIERHHREMGQPPKVAALNGRLEIGFAAMVLTLVDVIVFLPIAFLPGIPGLFLHEFALVVVISTLTSLFMSFTVTPSLTGNWALLKSWRPPRPVARFGEVFDAVRRRYVEWLLPQAMERPRVVYAVTALSLLVALALVPLGVVGFEFQPSYDYGLISITLNYPTGTPLDQTRQAVLALEREVDATSDLQAEVASAGSANSPLGGQLLERSVGQVQVFLKPKRAHSTAYWAQQFQIMANRLAPDAQPAAIAATTYNGGVTQPIDYLITTTSGLPSQYAPRVFQAMASTPGALDVTSSASTLEPEVNITFNRPEAEALNMDIGTAAEAVQAAFGGNTQVTQFQTTAGIEYVQVIYPLADQHSLAPLLEVPLTTNSGGLIHVGDIASAEYIQGPPLITRVNQRDVVHVTANVEPGVALSTVQQRFTARLAQLHLPSYVQVDANTTGNQANLSAAVGGMGAALIFSMALVYLLMVALFNNYMSPFIIMFTVPLAAVGALGGLALTRETLNLFSLLGTVLLIGLVAKNGILLVDFANKARERGADRLAAIREAARERFRPIIMTTFAMVFGMLPLAAGLEAGGSQRAPLGVVVIGGLMSSLLLSLVVIPLVYLGFTRPRRGAVSS
jgi:hydrophobic/amphiphilic exporter-1 (mainly G- bacteria), HAE1 family